MNKQLKTLEGSDDSSTHTGFLPYAERHVVLSEITYYIDEDVIAPSYYRHVVEKLSQLTENDQVRCMINSSGGMLAGLNSLMEATRNTSASTLAVLTGECHSAASILALMHDEITVSPYATMLVHFVRYGTSGKGQDVLDEVQHTHSTSVELFKMAYEGFLTEAEIDDCIKGKQLYLNAKGITDRLELRQTYRQLKMQDMQEELQAVMKEKKDKKKAKKKAKKSNKEFEQSFESIALELKGID